MPKAGFQFNIQKQHAPGSSGAFLTKKTHLDTKPIIIRVAEVNYEDIYKYHWL